MEEALSEHDCYLSSGEAQSMGLWAKNLSRNHIFGFGNPSKAFRAASI